MDPPAVPPRPLALQVGPAAGLLLFERRLRLLLARRRHLGCLQRAPELVDLPARLLFGSELGGAQGSGDFGFFAGAAAVPFLCNPL